MASKKRPTRRPQCKPSTTSRVPQPPTADALVYTEYDITDEPLDNRDIKKLPAQVQARARPQPGNRRGVDGVDLAVLAAQPYGFDWQMGQAPVGGPVNHGVEGERAPLHRTLHPMPAPAQMDHERQDSASQAPFGLD